MMVTIRMFARARDLAGGDAVTVEVSEPVTVAAVRKHVAAQVPALAGLLARSVFAVNGEFAGDEQPISAGAEVALLPPVSGG